MEFEEQVYFERPEDFATVRHLTIRGTNFEIGQAMGDLAIKRYSQSLEQFTSNPDIARARRLYFQRNYPIHWERMKGMAAAFDVNPEDDRHDLSQFMFNVDLPMQTPGCSVVYYPPMMTSNGSGYLSRNYDFSIGTMADLMQMPVPAAAQAEMVSVMSEPYIMEWHPEDGGYASLAIHAFDIVSGTLDGINSAGLVVSIMADEEAMAELGANLELHLGMPQAVGLHELQVMRLLLDTCETVAQAKEALLTIKQFYLYVPCHYIIADKNGNSFIYENSTGRNVQHIFEGSGKPQILTNFQMYKHPTRDKMPTGDLTLETNAFWRYQTLEDAISAHDGQFTPEDIKSNHACVNIRKLIEQMSIDPNQRSIAANVQSRTLWHSLYDQQSGTMEASFYLSEHQDADGRRDERRSDYIKFTLD